MAEHFDAERVRDDFFGFAFEVRVDEGYVVVAADHVAEGGEALFDSVNSYRGGEGVAEVLEFLVCGAGGDKEAFAVAVTLLVLWWYESGWTCMRCRSFEATRGRTLYVPSCQSADYSRACDRCMAYGYDILKLGFKDGVEVL